MHIIRTILLIIGGCSGETLVAKPDRLTSIAALKAHDFVICRTHEGTVVTRPIDMVKQRHVDEVIHVEFGNDELDVAVDQRFLLANEEQYITADQLTRDHQLLNIDGNPVIIDCIERRYGTYSLITLSVNEHHTFFVTKQGIVLHNNLTFGFIAIPERFEAPAKVAVTGAAGLIAIPVGTPVAGAIIACGCIYQMKDHITNACRAIGRGFAWLFSTSISVGEEAKRHLKKTTSIRHALHEIDLMADPEPNDDGTYRIYDPSPKHYPKPFPGQSPGPGWIEGQIALNCSWPAETKFGNSYTRVAFCKGEIVVFELTGRFGKFMIYHGYYQNENAINGMDDKIKRVLIKNQIINHRGKIII